MKLPSATTTCLTSLLLSWGATTFASGKAIRGSESSAETEKRQLQIDTIIPEPAFSVNDIAYNLLEGPGDLTVSTADGLLSNDVTLVGPFSITSFELLGVGADGSIINVPGLFQGILALDADNRGGFFYSPPDFNFVGTDAFRYTACDDATGIFCGTALVSLFTNTDPNKPNAAVVAEDDTFTMDEGTRLEVTGDGVFANDRIGIPSNPLFACEVRDDGGTTGDLTFFIDSGHLTYDAPRCTTGDEDFFYRACYTDYSYLVSNEARVRITVNSARPGEPEPGKDTYEVLEGNDLEIDADGLLGNDGCGDDNDACVVDSFTTSSDFKGDLEVNSDGSIKYDYVPGELGTFVFTYTVCQDGWPCVDCKDGTVDIVVKENPDKPAAPVWDNVRFTIDAGTLLEEDLIAACGNCDDRYDLDFSDFTEGSDFGGVLDGDDDGTFEYGQSSGGEDTFTFKACYDDDWPDLCTTATITIETNAPEPVESRSGVATFYEVAWSGEAQGSDCAASPGITMSCGGEGVPLLIELKDPESPVNSNDMCSNVTALDGTTTSIVCAGMQSGTVYVECRDSTSRDDTSRELIVTAMSKPVMCDTGSLGSNALNTISHSMGLKTLCGENKTWVPGGMICSGTSLNDADGNAVLCYETVAALDATEAAPADITMRSTGYETCVGQVEDLASGPKTLIVIGDADGSLDVPGYPLGECQADCDDDDECAGNLICFHRDEDVIPGCIGEAEEDRDYCVRPPQELSVSRNGVGSFP